MNAKKRTKISESKIVPIIGMQWGDEGKGKGVAKIASGLKSSDVIVRFQGGNNAGHTIWHKENGKQKCYVFHLIPSGVFGKAQIHLGAGMVVNPSALEEEMQTLPKNISFLDRLSVSPHAILTLPTHILLDSVSENSKGKRKIGSTGRGISPSYTDLVLRRALRAGDIFYKDFPQKYEALKKEHQETLLKVFNYEIKDEDLKDKEKKFWSGVKLLRSLKFVDSSEIVTKALQKNQTVIAEGAQGTLLDVRFGHYPYVTSSHTIAGGIATGLGIPPKHIGDSVGIFKAYVTKVGEGPFPTEFGGIKSAVWCRDKKFTEEKEKFPNPDINSTDDFEQGIALRRQGNEIGATTGRLRRTGWLDIPLMLHAIKINSAKQLVLTKLDVLNGLKNIKVCTHYVVDGKKTTEIPFDLSRTTVKCVYKTFSGWKGNLSDYGEMLPREAFEYVKFLEKTLNAKIIYVGTGPEEHHCIERYW